MLTNTTYRDRRDAVSHQQTMHGHRSGAKNHENPSEAVAAKAPAMTVVQCSAARWCYGNGKGITVLPKATHLAKKVGPFLIRRLRTYSS